MHRSNAGLVVTPTDLANFLTCRHKTALDLRAALGLIKKPTWVDPLAEVLQARGREHEARYVNQLRAAGLNVVDFGPIDYTGSGLSFEERLERTRDAMAQGADAIVQGALAHGDWRGYPDVLLRTEAGVYEAVDTKLTRETRGGTMLQLCVYTDLLAETSGPDRRPETFHVVTPLAHERYRFDDYGAYFRGIRERFVAFVEADRPAAESGEAAATYPDPVGHCDVCRWSIECRKRRRQDDHLSFVHGLGRNHAKELTGRGIATLASLAAESLPLAWKPSHGSADTFVRLREQARLQHQQREAGKPVFECLPVEQGFGLCALPEPRPGDLFLDLEGDPFGRPHVGATPGEGQREYLFGLARVNDDGTFACTARWAFSDDAEKQAFEETMAEIMAAVDADPAVHIYHYNHYEVTAFKRLAGRYATRESDLDRLLRGKRFVDLYAIVRRGLRAGVESYSLKHLEPFYAFKRDVELHEAGDQRRLVEVALETGDLDMVTPQIRATVEGYNRDDVRSTVELRKWLESVRAEEIAAGKEIPRVIAPDDQPSVVGVSERAQQVAAMRGRLLSDVPVDAGARSIEQQGRYLLAYMLDFHRREDKAEWWDYFRLRELPESDLIDESKAVAELEYVGVVERIRNSVVQQYRFPEQDVEIRPGDTLKRQDGKKFAEAIRVDRRAGTIDILVGPSRVHERPTALFAHDHIRAQVIEDSLMDLATDVGGPGSIDALPPGPARTLLLRLPPALKDGEFTAPEAGADVAVFASDLVTRLDATVLAIQGPPGSGKTYTGARMIEACVKAGLKVGVTANSHKVIRNLLREVSRDVRIAQKCGDDDVEAAADGVLQCGGNDEALAALTSGTQVLGGTAWLWARQEFAGSVDVLFVDEAGQMSLANALAVARAGRSMVLLGDPQQLDQPSKGSHPDGVAASVLQHILGGAETMPADRGLFLAETWRLAPAICTFTSELFYAGRLQPRAGLERQRLHDPERFDGAGLWVVEVEHHGNGSASDEEAAEVARLVQHLLGLKKLEPELAPEREPRRDSKALPLFETAVETAAGGPVRWTDADGRERAIGPDDIRILAPFNAHVTRIREALAGLGGPATLVPVGTVDKFQGQQAAVAIYSLATSHPDDAPKGMEFLYSLNRLNVATSRARCASIIVASPKLFEAECETPRRMRLANALCRFREKDSGNHLFIR